ncbi:MAG: hypothetical protein KGI98_06540 [Euryarchaeota archaeon]|nr:hypothetical protein [Euryarchaeota archaeon]
MGAPGALAVGTYVGLILVPGAVLYLSLQARLRAEDVGLLEWVLYSNLLGLTIAIGFGWLLARSDMFSIGGTAVLELLLVGFVFWLARRNVAAVIRRFRRNGLPRLREEATYLAVLGASVILLLSPLILLASKGLLIGDDTPQFAHTGNLIAQTGDWASSVQIFPQFPPSVENTAFSNPGIAVLYALFSAGTGTNSIYFAAALYSIPLLLTPTALFLLARRFSKQRVVNYALPIIWLSSSWVVGAIFANDYVATTWFQTSPDAVLGVLGLVCALVLLVDLVRGSGPQWFEVALLSASILLATLSDQLTFLFAACALMVFGLRAILLRGPRWSLVRGILCVLPTLVLLPPYLLPSEARGSSPALAGGAPLGWNDLLKINWPELTGTISIVGAIGLMVGAMALVTDTYRWGRSKLRGTPLPSSVGMVPLGALIVFACYLSFTDVGTNLLGVVYSRFYAFVGIALLPLVAGMLANLLKWSTRRRALRVVTISAVAVLLIGSGLLGVRGNLDREPSVVGSQTVFTPDMVRASDWLASHERPGDTVVADEMAGNAALQPMADFIPGSFLSRPRFGLYAIAYQAPTLYWGNPYFAMNQVMEYPTEANATTAWTNFSMRYFVYQSGYSASEIDVFSRLPYFQLAYSNPTIDIFEYVPRGGPGFIPAVSYSYSSPEMAPTYSGLAYSVAFELPHVPNTVASTYPGGSALDGSQIIYNLSVPSQGNYTLYLHRYSYKVGEYLNVSVNGVRVGAALFGSTGPNYGTPVTFPLSSGPVSITLTVGGTVGYVDPLDYLILDPVGALPPLSQS